MTDDSLIRLSASAVVDLLKRRQVSPLELIDAALARIAAVNPRINAMVTLCPERARDQARRLMKEGRAATDERRRLAEATANDPNGPATRPAV